MTCENQNLRNKLFVFLHVQSKKKYLTKLILDIKMKMKINLKQYVCTINMKNDVKQMISFNKA
jgi:hypothetical protein